MNESGKPLTDLAPEMVEDTDEPAFDIAIEMALGYELEVGEIEVLKNASKQEKEFSKKIDRIKDDIHAFLIDVDARFEAGNGHRAKIREALRLMLKLHIKQVDRHDTGLPFISHPLAVAHDALLMAGKNEDAMYICIAGLLHDSIEDQPRLLSLEKRIAVSQGKEDKIKKEIQRDGALGGLEGLFDARIKFLVGILTRDKNKTYKEYINGIFSNQDSSPSVVKWADLKQNALTIGLIREKAVEERSEGNEEASEKLEEKYKKFQVKYKPVLEALQVFFSKHISEHHPLYSQRGEIVASIENVLNTEYNT